MWDSKNTSDFGGGYNTTNQFDSPGTDKKKDTTKRAQSVTPVVIRMIKDCPEDEFNMWGHQTTILKFVCIVRKFDITSTTVTYELEDHTGKMNAVLWLEHDPTQTPEIPVDKENVYCRVYGTLRVKQGEKLIMILKIAQIDAMNELTSHLFEVVFVRVMAEKKHKGEIGGGEVAAGSDLTNSMMGFDAGGLNMEEGIMTPVQRKIYQILQGYTGEAGVAKEVILEQLPPAHRKEANDALEFLSSEGHIYSTVDHNHFKVTTYS